MDQHDLICKLKELAKELDRVPTRAAFTKVVPAYQLEKQFGTYADLLKAAGLETYDERRSAPGIPPKVLLLDIETMPMEVYTWGIWEQNIGLNMIIADWSLASFAGKWLDSDEMIYFDQRKKRNFRDDKEITEKVWELIDQAGVIITKNGKRFDERKLNEKFMQHGLTPPSKPKHIDVEVMFKRVTRLTSNKQEWLTQKFNKQFQKLKHDKFPGFELWSQCMKGNQDAWEEMEKYNKHDVLSMQELYLFIRPWGNHPDLNVYSDSHDNECSCGSKEFKKHSKPAVTATGRFDRYICKKCGAESRGKDNHLTKEKRASLRARVT